MLCPACRAPVTGHIVDHYRTCAALAEMFPIARRKKAKSKHLCTAHGCKQPRCGGNRTLCKRHEAERSLMYQRQRKGISANRYRV